MKKKRMATAALAAMMALTAVGGMTVYGASDTKTATLNNAKVRFNDGSVQTIQCYNIDGFNFVRARDITNNLDMAVYAIQNGTTGVLVNPHNNPTSKDALEKLTQQSAKVKVETGKLVYDALATDAECFLLNGRYYFKLADFEKAADYQLETALHLVENEAKEDIVDKPYRSVYPSISVEWDADARVINVNRVETDLQQIFDDIRSGKIETAKPDKEEVVEKDEEKQPEADKEEKFKATGVLTSAPKEGKVLANILKDEDEGAYLDNGEVNMDNLTGPYLKYGQKYPYNIGQCTWYAMSRLEETTGVNLEDNIFWGNGLEKYVTNAQSDKCPDLKGTTDPEAIEAGCMGVFKGHALFVEWVDFDDEGNPETVYFTEGNTQHNGKYYPDKDAKVQVMDFDDFIVRQSFIGYVIVK